MGKFPSYYARLRLAARPSSVASLRTAGLRCVLVLLAACGSPPVDSDTDVPIDDFGPPYDFGVASSCDVDANGGFDDFYADGDAVLVHGTSDADRELGAYIHAYYAEFFDTMDLKSVDELDEADRQRNLMILGTPSTNPLLAELDTVPVRFGDGEFEFGNRLYDEPGSGIALIAPNPWNPDAFVTIYAGNTLDGAFSTFTLPTGDRDYQTTRGRGTLMQEGDLCRSADGWTWFSTYDDDDAADAWEDWIDQLERERTDHIEFYYLPSGAAADEMSWSADWSEDQYLHAIELLEVEPLDERIRAYYYPDNATKGEITGESGNGHANDLNYEVHEVFSYEFAAVGAHEDTHVIAWHRIGDAGSALFGEGLAVYTDFPWGGVDDNDEWVAEFRDSGDLPALGQLIGRWSQIDDNVSYPVSGSFVAWVADTYGIDTVKRLYVRDDLDQAFEDELDLTTDEVETAWLATIP